MINNSCIAMTERCLSNGGDERYGGRLLNVVEDQELNGMSGFWGLVFAGWRDKHK